jgi:hypothetical protein
MPPMLVGDGGDGGKRQSGVACAVVTFGGSDRGTETHGTWLLLALVAIASVLAGRRRAVPAPVRRTSPRSRKNAS